jgi:hypothetical protein
VPKEREEKPVQVTYRRDDLTYGRIETSRKLPSTHRQDQPVAVDRITVEEITFPRRTTVTSKETHQVSSFISIYYLVTISRNG